jgi:hypothetical protein
MVAPRGRIPMVRMIGKLVALYSVAILLSVPAVTAAAASEQLRGTQFLYVLNGNTLTGKDEKGVFFFAYFLAGGGATYEDSTGFRDVGEWTVRADTFLCIRWQQRGDNAEHCGTASLSGKTLNLKGGSLPSPIRVIGTIAGGR